mmetsp:Transcript_17144/g.25885  ORF Transcript_17144/g.25885 Transcript_17144/m.25885 type:complete len:121 (+) Transcript_17144:1646-2008(+)
MWLGRGGGEGVCGTFGCAENGLGCTASVHSSFTLSAAADDDLSVAVVCCCLLCISFISYCYFLKVWRGFFLLVLLLLLSSLEVGRSDHDNDDESNCSSSANNKGSGVCHCVVQGGIVDEE